MSFLHFRLMAKETWS